MRYYLSDLSIFSNATVFKLEIASDVLTDEEKEEAIESWQVVSFGEFQLII